jgi:hypothetical protein
VRPTGPVLQPSRMFGPVRVTAIYDVGWMGRAVKLVVSPLWFLGEQHRAERNSNEHLGHHARHGATADPIVTEQIAASGNGNRDDLHRYNHQNERSANPQTAPHVSQRTVAIRGGEIPKVRPF